MAEDQGKRDLSVTGSCASPSGSNSGSQPCAGNTIREAGGEGLDLAKRRPGLHLIKADDDEGDEDLPPPLPPRPRMTPSPQPPVTGIDPVDIQTLQFPDGSRGTFQTAGPRLVSMPGQLALAASHASVPGLGSAAEVDDSLSMAAPTLRSHGDLASIIAGDATTKSPAWHLLRSQSAAVQPFETVRLHANDSLDPLEKEFEPIPGASEEAGVGDDQRLAIWKAKLKHYMILSSSGKPIYSRHGDLYMVNSFMGIIQAIISFYDEAGNPLRAFTAGGTRFVVVMEGPLYLVAISRLGESDSQLRSQLDALYMQILSTLTLPNLTSIFAHRPNTDLRKPLAGTEPFLSSLADSFTRGSPSMLLGALECLKLRKSHRAVITSAFLKSRTGEELLYGLIVAGGRLVSVIRPRRHSLHPSDLQLIFNMLFESGGIRSNEGENWIPICLPAFNKRGYLYMYVSFFDIGDTSASTTLPTTSSSAPDATLFSLSHQPSNDAREDSIAVILISPSPTSFYDLQATRNNLISNLSKSQSLSHIQASIRSGRPFLANEISAGTQLSHFLYKSRANVQFCMPSLSPQFEALLPRRKLMSLYHSLHSSAHARNCHLNALHCIAEDSTSLVWITPTFELYCVSGPNVSRAAMTHGASRVVQWAKREEERLFIIGGGVF